MQIRAITIEREFGCGGSEIAAKLAQLLGWRLWDHELTQEIARLTNSSPQAVEQREWKNDPAVYRVFKSFLRGAFEGGLPPTDRLQLLDARGIAVVSERAVNDVISRGPCVIVGRGSQHFLRNRPDVLRVFLYASRELKVRRLIGRGKSEKEAQQLVDSVDSERSAFIDKYFHVEWPSREVYHTMINTGIGDELVVDMVLEFMHTLEASLPVAHAHH